MALHDGSHETRRGPGGREVNGVLTLALWLHVAAASWWILASVTIAVGAAAVGSEGVEGREFMTRVVPRLNGANAAAAAIVLPTGVINIYAAGARRRFHFSPAFTWILAAKAGLYVVMAAALMASFKAARAAATNDSPQSRRAGKLAALAAAAAIAGTGAMMLGVWLAG